MSMFSNWLNPGRAYGEAGRTVQQGYDNAHQTQQPFYQGGVNAGGKLTDAMGRLLNPGGLQDEWNKSYETSETAKQDMRQAEDSGLGAASSMGLMGSSTATQAIQSGAHNIMNKDRQQYLDDMMKKYMTGIGIGTNMYNTGATTAANMGQQDVQSGQDQANLGVGRSQADGKRFGDILTTIGNLAGGMGAWQ